MSLTTSLQTNSLRMRRNWLPRAHQLRAAALLNLPEAIDGHPMQSAERVDGPKTSMQQGLGLVIFCGLLAGLLPSLIAWILATQAGTSTALLGLARQSAGLELQAVPAPFAAVVDALRTAAGVDPVFPGWLAALLSGLGNWLNWPLRFLSLWIVFGLAALLAAKLFGAPTTLQRFYAGTSYAAIPLVLLGFTVIPYLGILFALAALVLALVVYGRALQHVTGLDSMRSALCTLVPWAAAFLFALVASAAVVASAVRTVLW